MYYGAFYVGGAFVLAVEAVQVPFVEQWSKRTTSENDTNLFASEIKKSVLFFHIFIENGWSVLVR